MAAKSCVLTMKAVTSPLAAGLVPVHMAVAVLVAVLGTVALTAVEVTAAALAEVPVAVLVAVAVLEVAVAAPKRLTHSWVAPASHIAVSVKCLPDVQKASCTRLRTQLTRF